MSASGVPAPTAPSSGSAGAVVVRTLLQYVVVVALQAIALFAGAGSLAWPAGWIYLGLYAGLLVVGTAVLLPQHRQLLIERSRGARGGERWDFWITRLFGAVFLGTLVTAGLDERLGWTPALPLPLRVGGASLVVVGYAVTVWAMSVNPYFSQTVRIQPEGGHTVVTDGPYTYVRHPGYSGMLIAGLGSTFLLGSLWALIPWVLYVAVTVARTLLEDRALHAGLPGYPEYARRTRYRLIPQIW